jgi:LPXTG-site transpeptidase (sortase) family protein
MTSKNNARLFSAVSLLLLILVQVALRQPVQIVSAAPEERPLFAGPPAVTLDVPSEVLIGEDVNFTVTFNNPDSTDTGYGPLIDLVLPTSGADGPTDPDGLFFNGATYLGATIEHTVITIPASGCITHPYMMDGSTMAPLQVCGLTEGDTFVALRLPFGSFTPNQPTLSIDVSATMSNWADVGKPLTIQARGGYQYGYDPLDNFDVDNPTATLSPWTSASVTPILFRLEKTYHGPEDETATGPNFPRQYTVTATIAPGQTLTNFRLSDVLPDNLQFASLVSTNPTGADCEHTDPAKPDGILTCDFTSVSGTVEMTFSFYVPLDDADGDAVIDPDTGDDVTSCNNSSASGDWVPLDPRDEEEYSGTHAQDPAGCEHTLTPKSIATQKDVSVVGGGEVAPGKVLEYVIDVQISDYFVFDQVVATDIISDGQRFDGSFTPTLQIVGNPSSLNSSGVFDSANYSVIGHYSVGTPPDPANNGTTELVFRVSDEMESRTPSGADPDGRLIGGCVPPGGTGSGDPDCSLYNDGATTARIVFRTIVQEVFSDAYPPKDPNVDQGDVLDNEVEVVGRLLETTDSTSPTGYHEDDSSAASIAIDHGALQKALYALNGNTNFQSPMTVAAGDTVTFRLTYTLPTSDYENLVITDYLPLPIFDATEVTAHINNICGIPAAGTSCLGPSDTYHGLTGAVNPALSSNAGSNWVRWNYGSYNSTQNSSSWIDLLFTVTVTDAAFADKMHLTNQGYAIEDSTNAGISTSTAIDELLYTAPEMVITKSVVATDNPNATFSPPLPAVTFYAPGTSGVPWNHSARTINSAFLESTPIDSNLSGVDADDLVTFAIFLVNNGTGKNGAFDLLIKDAYNATAFEWPDTSDPDSINLRIFYGNGGGPISYTGTDQGEPTDLFTTGIELVDPPGGGGVCAPYHPDSGLNVIVIAYDLRVKADIEPGDYKNIATLESYAGSEGGESYPPQSDDAVVTTASPEIEKELLGTELDNTYNTKTQAVIGEYIEYKLEVTIPEGKLPAASIVDTLDAGLAFVDLQSLAVSNSTEITSTVMTFDASGNCSNCGAGTGTGSNPLISNNGRTITFNFGDLVNSNTNNTVAETITITYRAVVLNVVGNQAGGLRKNSARLSWTGGSLPPVSAENVTIIEPQINTVKSVLPTSGDAGDLVTFTVTLTNPTTGSTTAYDVTWSDTIPLGLTYVAGSLAEGACTASTHPVWSDAGAPTLTASGGLFHPGQSCTVTFSATIDYSVTPGQLITNIAETRWTSLDGDVSTPRSDYNDDAVERTGADGVGGALNDYASRGAATVNITKVQPEKTLVATSEAHTDDSDVAIGEIVRYRLVVQLPEGTSPNFQIRDNLPSGMTFLNDGTATLALVSNGSPIISTEPTGSTLNLALGSGSFGTDPWVNGNDPAGITPTFVLPNQNVGSSNSLTADPDAYGNGTDPYFKLGTLVNNDSDLDGEYVIIEFNALVNNTIAGNNQVGDELKNTFSVFIGGTLNATSNSVTVTVVEPHLTLNKANPSITGEADAGGVVNYTVKLENTGNATAFEAHFIDELPDVLELNIASIQVDGVPTPGTSAGNTVELTFDEVPVGGEITITYSATILITISPEQVVTNTAEVVYTSLPGTGTPTNPTGSQTPGDSGAGDGERDGSGGINDYRDDDFAKFTSDGVAIEKIVKATNQDHTAGTDVAIGEIVTYQVTVTLPEGTVSKLKVIDSLPDGLQYVTGSAVVIPADGVIFSTGDPVISTSDNKLIVTFNHDVVVVGDNDTTNNNFVLTYDVRVLNVLGNQNDVELSNEVTVSWTDANGVDHSETDSTDVSIVEPDLNIEKTADSLAWDYGQTVTYTLKITHTATSTADAFDIVVIDTIPDELTYVTGSITAPTGCTSDDSAAPILEWTCGVIQLSGHVSLSYQVTVNGPSNPPYLDVGDTAANNAKLTWSSLPGDNDPGAEDGERDGSGDVNDYYDEDEIEGGLALYALGNRVWFDTNNNQEIDTGEVGVDGVTVELYAADSNGDPTGAAIDTTTTSGGGYYLFNGLISGDYVVVLPASNFSSGAALQGYWSSGTTRNDDGTLSEVAAPDPDNDIDSDDNGELDLFDSLPGAVASRAVTLGPGPVEPTGETDLDDGNQGQPDARANMTVDFGFYTIRLGNLVWDDFDDSGTLDSGEPGIDGVSVQLYSADGNALISTTSTAGGGLYTFTGLPQGNYFVRLPESNFLGSGALRDYYSSTGGSTKPYEPAPNPDDDTTDSDDNGTEFGVLGFPGGYIQTSAFGLTPQGEQDFDHSDGSTTEFRVDFGVFQQFFADLAITKDDGTDYYLPGSTWSYTIVVSNNGPSDVIGAEVTDSIPPQIESWTWTCVEAGGASGCDGYGPGNDDFYDEVDLPVGSSITYTVTVTSAADASGMLINTAVVTPPEGVIDPTPENNEDTDEDRDARLSITKDDGLITVSPGTLITYTLIVENLGAQNLSTIVVTDELPDEVTFQSADPDPTSAPPPGTPGGTLTWENISLDSSESMTIKITVRVNDDAVGPTILNSVIAEDIDTGSEDSDDDIDIIATSNAKIITDTSIDDDPLVPIPAPTLPSTLIGEIITYRIDLDVPAGAVLPNLQALDVLDHGLAFVGCLNIEGGTLTTTLPGGFDDACNDPINPLIQAEPAGNTSASDQGRQIIFSLGDVINPSDTEDEILSIYYQVIVLNIPENVDGVDGLKNQVIWTWDGGSLEASAPPIEIIEPKLGITKEADPTTTLLYHTITFTISIAHTPESSVDAYDVEFVDVIPYGLQYVDGSVFTSGLPPTSITYTPGSKTLSAFWDVFPLGQNTVITFKATFLGPSPVTNTAFVEWTSLPIDPQPNGQPQKRSEYNDFAYERWYNPSDPTGVNNYGDSDWVIISLPETLPETGFAPNHVTVLPSQPPSKAYTGSGKMWLEIPALGLNLPITGIPLTQGGWDLTWLSNQAGYLSGTTYPGQVGNTGLTAHTTLADGTPGPFHNLDRLLWGSTVILHHADGYRYTYEVRDNYTVLAHDLSVFKQDGYSWLTLITCKGFNPWLDTYSYRTVVKAVLLRVELEP